MRKRKQTTFEKITDKKINRNAGNYKVLIGKQKNGVKWIAFNDTVVAFPFDRGSIDFRFERSTNRFHQNAERLSGQTMDFTVRGNNSSSPYLFSSVTDRITGDVQGVCVCVCTRCLRTVLCRYVRVCLLTIGLKAALEGKGLRTGRC